MNLSKYIATKTYSSFKKSFTRSILRISIVATAIGLAVIIIANAIFSGFQKEISTKVFGFWGHIHITDIRVNRSIEAIPINYNDSLKQLLSNFKYRDEIEHAQGFVINPGILSHGDYADGLFFKGISSDFKWDKFGSYIKSGEPLKFADSTNTRNIIVSEQTAARLFLKIGDAVILHYIKDENHIKRKLKVSGIYKTGLEEYDKKFALVDQRMLQELMSWNPNQVTGVELFIKQISKASAISNYLYEEVLPSTLYSETIRDKFPNIFEWLSLQDINKTFILGLVLIVCLINMATMLLILILERTHMIGVLSALGMNVWTQRKIFLYFAARILLQGMLFGNLIGLSLIFLQKKYKFVSLSEQDYYLNYAPVNIEFSTLLILNGLFFVVVVVFLLIPSYFISRIKPIDALKFR